MSGLVNKVKEALSSDKHDHTHTTGTTHTTSATHPAEPRTGNVDVGTTGHDGSHTAGDHYVAGGDTANRGVDGPATRTDGPHSSNLVNKVDPRVDSDRDHSKNLGANPHGTATTGNTATTGHSTTTGHTTTGHTTTAGPHSSNLANKVDPRVDSDRDGSRNLGAASHTTTTGQHSGAHVAGTGIGAGTHQTSAFGNTGTTGHTTCHHGQASTFGNTGTTGHTAGVTGQTSTFGNTGTTGHTTNAGPHNSNLANKVDPRVDSDLDGSRNLGANTTTTHRNHPGHTTHGHNTTGLATGAAVAGHHGTHGTHGTHTDANRGFDGPASKTDGPHSSNLANKIDPRVDSDRDHSKNLGANPSGTATTGNPSTTTHGTSGIHSTTGTGDAFFTGNTTHGTTGTHGTHTGTHGTGVTGTGTHTQGVPEGQFGEHNSRLANAADPRIDSDRDGSHTIGSNTHSTTTGHTGTHVGTTGAGIGSHTTHTGTGAYAGTTGHTGTHTGTTGHTGTHTGTTGHTGTHTGHTGTHTGATGTGLAGSHHAPGPAPNTAGPHKSDLLNKMDPRVDSDLDGSKTVGGDKTYAQP